MRRSWIVAVPLAFTVAACSDSIGPGDDDLVDLVLDFCAGEAPAIFAVQNEGRAWTRVTEDAGSTFRFGASERVGIALIYDFGTTALTDVYYTTAEELEPLTAAACNESFGSKVFSGSVTGANNGDPVVISMGGVEERVIAPPSTFQLTDVRDGPTDLVAHRKIPSVNGDVPVSVIIRRALNLNSGATLTPLDFSGASAIATNTLTIGNLFASDDNYLDVTFSSQLGTTHLLHQSMLFNTSSQPIYGIPSSERQSGDIHRLDLNGDATNGQSYRSVRHWYAAAANKSLSFGPVLAQPSISSVASSPYLRMRATLPSQAEYPSFATAFFSQTSSGNSVYVTQTAAYRGGLPSVWNLEIPDLTSVSGYSTALALQSGTITTWYVEAYSGGLATVIGRSQTDGATVTFAGRSSALATVRADAAYGAAARSRPPLAGNHTFRRSR